MNANSILNGIKYRKNLTNDDIRKSFVMKTVTPYLQYISEHPLTTKDEACVRSGITPSRVNRMLRELGIESPFRGGGAGKRKSKRKSNSDETATPSTESPSLNAAPAFKAGTKKPHRATKQLSNSHGSSGGNYTTTTAISANDVIQSMKDNPL